VEQNSEPKYESYTAMPTLCLTKAAKTHDGENTTMEKTQPFQQSEQLPAEN
jgi:hypothetical protein